MLFVSRTIVSARALVGWETRSLDVSLPVVGKSIRAVSVRGDGNVISTEIFNDARRRGRAASVIRRVRTTRRENDPLTARAFRGAPRRVRNILFSGPSSH